MARPRINDSKIVVTSRDIPSDSTLLTSPDLLVALVSVTVDHVVDDDSIDMQTRSRVVHRIEYSRSGELEHTRN